MNTRQIIFKNIILQIVLIFLNLAVGAYSLSLIARYLGKESLGKYNFIFSFYAFFIALLDFGISFIALREISHRKSEIARITNNLLTFKIFIGISLLLIALILVNALPFPRDLKAALLFYSPILLILAFESIQIIFEANLRQEYIVLASVLWRIASLLFVILAIRLHLGLNAIVLSFLLAELVKCAVFYISLDKTIKIRVPVIEVSLWREMFSAGMPIFIMAILGTSIRNIDVMLLAKIKGFTEVGLYAIPYRLCDTALALPISLMASVFPLMSKFYKHDFRTLKQAYQKSFDILSVCGILLTILVLAFADKIIILLFGAGFIKSAAAFRILIFSTLLIYLTISAGSLLIAIDKQIVNMWFYLLGAALNIILNLILIPRLGFIGASLSNVITMFLIVSLTFYFVGVKFRIPLQISKLIKASIAGLASLGLLFYLKETNIFISMPISIMLYAFLVIFLKAIDMDDIMLLVKKAG